MKKTLIALAAVAAATGAMAQSTVTLSGKYGFAYQKGIGGVANFATTDGDVRFTAVEDLGGGLKATAAMEVRVRGRGNSDAGNDNTIDATKNNLGVGGRNATLGLQGGFGSLTLGSVEAGNGIMGRGWAGAPISLATGYDGAILSGVANVDWARYVTPEVVPGLTFNAQRLDSIFNPGTTKGTSANVVGVDYAAGPLSAGADYTSFSTTQKRTRVSASYDFGVAAVGFGWEDFNDTKAQYTMGVKVPMGAITLGAAYANNRETGDKGWAVGADYAFSKRTVLNVSYGDKTHDNFASLANGDQFRVRLMHSF